MSINYCVVLICFRLLDIFWTNFNRFFTTNGWKWDNRNGHALQSSLNEVDRKEFDIDMSTLHWPSYVGESAIVYVSYGTEGMCLGVKKFLLKEDMARVHVARRAQHRFVSPCLFAVLMVQCAPVLTMSG